MSQFDKPITELARMALQKPDDFGYWGHADMFVTWGFTGHDKSPMSKNLGESNFKAISDDLMTRYPDDFRIENYRHWVCGWVDRLVCRILINEKDGIVESNITDAFKAAIDYQHKLENYPIIDEDLYNEMQAADIINCITDLPPYLINMIDQDDMYWVDKILQCLWEDLDVYIDPDAELYPKDGEILMAVYMQELWNPENIDLWQEFCEENNLEFPPKKKNPNQLTLFEY